MSHQHQPHNSNSIHTATAAPSAPAPKGADQSNSAASLDAGNRPATDRIRLRAYEISQARSGGPGNAMSDWAQAEMELTSSTTH